MGKTLKVKGCSLVFLCMIHHELKKNKSSKVSRINTCSTDTQQATDVNNNQNENQNKVKQKLNTQTFTKTNGNNKWHGGGKKMAV